MGPWRITFEVDPASPLPLFVQLSRTIANDVRRGRLRPGERLPGTRELARTLRLNRNTIAAAYGALEAEGWIAATVGSGTYVRDDLPGGGPIEGARDRRGRARPAGAELGFDLQAPDRPFQEDASIEASSTKWDFGLPDVRLAPTKELARAYRRALRDRGTELLQYERYRVERAGRLAVALASMVRATRALDAGPENIVVTQGSQMAFYLVARAILRPGDRVVVEAPGAYVLWNVLEDAGATILPVEVDAEGLRVDLLRERIAEGRVRAIVLTPHHQFPTTVSLSIGRRSELSALARRHRIAIIEDDYDHEYHYDGPPLLPLAANDPGGQVIYLGTLSKLFGPGLRLGYLVGPKRLVDEVRRRRRMIDLQGDGVLEAAVAELFEDGEITRHFNRARRAYRERRDFLAHALESRLSSVLSFRVPAGGMAIWARVAPDVDVDAWAARARERGLLVRTGQIFSPTQASLPFLRLGYARFDESELLRAATTLARALPPRRRR